MLGIEMDLPPIIMLASGIAAFFGIAMGLYAVAMFVGREIAIHNLAVEAHTLRREHTRKLAALRGEISEDSEANFEYVEDDGAERAGSAVSDAGAETQAKRAA